MHSSGTNLQDSSGNRPLRWATLRGDLDIIKLLLQYDAGINSTSSDGYSALALSVFQRDLVTTKLLLENNADPDSAERNSKSEKCRSPLQIAQFKDYPEMVKLLRGDELVHESEADAE